MPAIILSQRRPDLSERMDDPDCPLDRLHRTYDQFRVLNPLISGWRTLYRRHIHRATACETENVHEPAAPHRDPPLSLLDVGCGGGDILAMLAGWLERDGIPFEALGIDPDPRAMDYVRKRSFPAGVWFEAITTGDLLKTGRRFDIVISNHVLHHLTDDELLPFLAESRTLARHQVLHNDIRRDDLAWLLFAPTRLLFHGSFITVDGLTSIRRSWRPRELRGIIPDGWEVHPFGLFRNLVTCRGGDAP